MTDIEAKIAELEIEVAALVTAFKAIDLISKLLAALRADVDALQADMTEISRGR